MFSKEILISALILQASVFSLAQSLDPQWRRYEAEIQRQERQLRSLKRNLREKEEKASQWKSLADEARSRWENVSSSMKWAQAQWKAAQRAYSQTSHKAEVAQQQTATQQRRADSMTEELAQVARVLYAQAEPLVAARYSQVAQALTHVLPDIQRETFASAQKEEALKQQATRWKQAEILREQETQRLKANSQTQWSRWQNAQRQQQLLKDEVSQSEQSAKAMQIILTQLRRTRDLARANQTPVPVLVSDAPLRFLRASLPWPANGTIIQSFGKQFSSELEQLLVSNGIRVQASAQQPVRTVRTGEVIFARPFNHYGQMIVVQHTKGLATVYAGLGTLEVREGDRVGDLQTIGATDNTGRYYFELRQEERPLDPLLYLVPLRRKSS